MKKSFVFVLLIALGLSLISTAALAENTNWKYGFTAQCVNESTLNNAGQYHPKKTTKNYIEVRTNIIGSGNPGFNNRIYAHIQGVGYYGAKWHLPDGIYHACSDSRLAAKGINVTPGGRGNTRHHDELGITSIRLEGQFRTH